MIVLKYDVLISKLPFICKKMYHDLKVDVLSKVLNILIDLRNVRTKYDTVGFIALRTRYIRF